MGRSGWRDKVQSQSSPSNEAPDDQTQFQPSKRSVASVHASALASFSSAATLSNWRRDSSRAHPCKTLRNRRVDSVGADRNAWRPALQNQFNRALHGEHQDGRRGTVPAKMASKSVKKQRVRRPKTFGRHIKPGHLRRGRQCRRSRRPILQITRSEIDLDRPSVRRHNRLLLLKQPTYQQGVHDDTPSLRSSRGCCAGELRGGHSKHRETLICPSPAH